MDAIATFQHLVADTLLDDPWFQDIPIITQDKGDIDTLVNEALHAGAVVGNEARKAGLAIIVVTPEGENVQDDSMVVMLKQNVRLLIAENGPINRSETGIQKLPTEVLHRAILKLHNYRTGRGPVALRFTRFDYELLDGIGQFTVDFATVQTLQLAPP
jgi:hypothetical protein